VMVYAHGSPDPYIVDGSRGGAPVLICAVAGLLAVIAAVIVARPRVERATEI
jgi:hypothetical protein